MAGRSLSVWAQAAARARRAGAVRADSVRICAERSRIGLCAAPTAGGSPRITWALVPPKPNALTPARRPPWTAGQARTLVAHRWENEGDPLTVTAQFLDSTNVPDGILPRLWAPVGLRFHALHHLLPSLPYHALATAHERISGAFGDDSTYAKANYPTLRGLLGRLFSSTMTRNTAN